MRFRTMVPAALGLALLLLPTAVAATTPAVPVTPTVSVALTINDCAFDGTAASVPGNALTIKLRSAAGKLKHTWAVPIVAATWFVDCPGPRVRIGDRLQLFATGAATPIRTFVVPKLQLRPDRVHDKLNGNAPGNADKVQVAVHRCDPALSLCSKSLPVQIGVAAGTGAFSIATGDLTGAALTRVMWTKGADFVQLRQYVARFVVRPGSATVTGFGSRTGQSVSISLRRGQATGLANPTTRPDASFKGTLKKGGRPMKVRAGDLVSSSLASDATMRVPVTSLTFDGDSIDGQCFKGAPVAVERFGTDGGLIAIEPTVSDSTGHWTLAWVPLAGTTIRAWCGDPNGDAVLNELVAI